MVGAPVVSRIAHRTSEREPPERFRHWWRELPEDFWRHREEFELELRDVVAVQATAAADRVMCTLGACLLSATVLPVGFRPSKMREAEKDLRVYAPYAKAGNAADFFDTPEKPVRVEIHPAPMPHFVPADGVCEDLVFESPFVPVNPRVREEYLSHGANRMARARYWRHASGPRPTVIALHGFSADLYALNEWFFALPRLYQLGFDIALLTLPFHGKRQTRFSPFSGHGFFAGGPARINEAVAQSVLDARHLVSWLLAERGAKGVGLTGVSLGGFVTATLACVEKRLAFAIPNVPVVSIADLALEWEPLGTMLRSFARRGWWSLADARALLAASSPLSYQPVLEKERLFVIGGVGDRLAPPKHARVLWDHWGRCRLHWFPGSHLLHFDRGRYLEEIERFVGELGFLTKPSGPARARKRRPRRGSGSSRARSSR